MPKNPDDVRIINSTCKQKQIQKCQLPSNLDECLAVAAGIGQREYGRAERLQAKHDCSHAIRTQDCGTSKDKRTKTRT